MIKVVGDSHDGAYEGMKGVSVFYADAPEPITMHRIGRDGFDLSFFRLDRGDTPLLVYGEVDARGHVQRQIDKGRSRSEIINSLVYPYLETVLKSGVNPIVRFIVPPSSFIINDDTWPQVGTLEQRVCITREFNKTLKKACEIKNVIFIDVHPDLINKEGVMAKDYDNEDGAHLNEKAFPLVREQLLTQLHQRE